MTLTRNDDVCPILRIGTIRIKIFDGIVGNLKDVCYIFALRKILIFVSSLEDKGFRVAIENGVLKFLSDAMVIMKVVRQRKLYYLMGRTISGDAVLNTIRLWHKRLGHTGDWKIERAILAKLSHLMKIL